MGEVCNLASVNNPHTRLEILVHKREVLMIGKMVQRLLKSVHKRRLAVAARSRQHNAEARGFRCEVFGKLQKALLSVCVEFELPQPAFHFDFIERREQSYSIVRRHIEPKTTLESHLPS